MNYPSVLLPGYRLRRGVWGAIGRIVVLLMALAVGLGGAVGASRAQSGSDQALSGGVVDAYQTLVGVGLTLAERTNAAERLLMLRSRESERALVSALAVGQDPDAWRATLAAIATDFNNPPEGLGLPVFSMMMRVEPTLVDEWGAAVARFGDSKWRHELQAIAVSGERSIDERSRSIAALGYFREKSVAKVLIDLTATGQADEVRRAAFEALATLTGITTFGESGPAWEAWYQSIKGFNDTKWNRHLVDNFTRRESLVGARQEQLEDRLLQSQRALYRTTDAKDKPAVLAYMLGDPLLPIRQLGIEFAKQRLVDGQPFDEPLRAALRARLEDEASDVRKSAAQLLHDLADAKAADLAATRLKEQAEPVAGVVRSLLRLVTRLPRADAVGPALDMLANDTLRGEAAGALAAAHDAEMLSRRDADKARRELRQYLRSDGNPPPQVITLLAKIGDDDDWNSIAGWVNSKDPAIKEAAATAWANSDRSLKLLADLMDDSAIQPIVIAAAYRRGNDAGTLHALARGRPSSDQTRTQWERALVAMAGRVAPEAVVRTEQILFDAGYAPSLRDRLLTAAIDAADEDEDPKKKKPEAYAYLLFRRGEARMELGNAALAVLDFERLSEYDKVLTAQDRQRRDRDMIEVYLQTNADDKAFAVLNTLLGDGSGQLRPSAVDDPMVSRFIDASKRHVESGRTEQAYLMLDRLRGMMGRAIKPEVAQRIAAVQFEIDRSRGRGGDTEFAAP